MILNITQRRARAGLIRRLQALAVTPTDNTGAALFLLVPMKYLRRRRERRVRVEEAVLGASAETFSGTPVESGAVVLPGAVVLHAGVGGMGFCGAVPIRPVHVSRHFTQGRTPDCEREPRTRR
jgi:hypothetical protein